MLCTWRRVSCTHRMNTTCRAGTEHAPIIDWSVHPKWKASCRPTSLQTIFLHKNCTVLIITWLDHSNMRSFIYRHQSIHQSKFHYRVYSRRVAHWKGDHLCVRVGSTIRAKYRLRSADLIFHNSSWHHHCILSSPSPRQTDSYHWHKCKLESNHTQLVGFTCWSLECLWTCSQWKLLAEKAKRHVFYLHPNRLTITERRVVPKRNAPRNLRNNVVGDWKFICFLFFGQT